MAVVSTNRNEGLRVVGLPELHRALRAMGHDMDREFSRGMRLIADRVIERAQGKMPYITGTAARSLKPVSVRGGGAGIKFPGGGPGSATQVAGYYPWLDFGGGLYGARGVTSFSPVAHVKNHSQLFKRAKVEGGRYLYPSIGQSTDFIADTLGDLIEKVAHGQQFTVR
jgi:hypothetical protein